MFPYLIAAPYAVILVFYMISEGKGRFRASVVLKLCLSCIFAATSWIAAVMTGMNNTVCIIIAGAQTVAIAADFYLEYIHINNRKFIAGINLFSAVQVLLIIAFYMAEPFHFADIVLFACLLLFILLLGIQKWNTKEQNPYITIYIMLVAFMAAKGASCCIVRPEFLLATIGGCLFFAADVFLGFWKYKSGKMGHAYANWILYFSGQLLIAFSLFGAGGPVM